jgi:hypothetical protein
MKSVLVEDKNMNEVVEHEEGEKSNKRRRNRTMVRKKYYTPTLRVGAKHALFWAMLDLGYHQRNKILWERAAQRPS